MNFRFTWFWKEVTSLDKAYSGVSETKVLGEQLHVEVVCDDDVLVLGERGHVRDVVGQRDELFSVRVDFFECGLNVEEHAVACEVRGLRYRSA